MPGVEISLDALTSRGAKLPRIDLVAPRARSARARSTRSAPASSSASPAPSTACSAASRRSSGRRRTTIATGGLAGVVVPYTDGDRRGRRPPDAQGPQAAPRAQRLADDERRAVALDVGAEDQREVVARRYCRAAYWSSSGASASSGKRSMTCCRAARPRGIRPPGRAPGAARKTLASAGAPTRRAAATRSGPSVPVRCRGTAEAAVEDLVVGPRRARTPRAGRG